MKKLLLILTMLLSFGAFKAQISDVQQKGSYLYVYGEDNQNKSTLSLGGTDEYLGMGSTFFVVKRGSYIYTYDSDSRNIGSLSLPGDAKFKSAGGSSFNIKIGSYIYTYDRKCNSLSSRSE